MCHTSFGRMLFLAGLLALPSPTSAQLISLKTVPLAAGDQFLIFPSDNLAMGGVSIALDDRALDPFGNPAMGSRIEESHVFSSPTFWHRNVWLWLRVSVPERHWRAGQAVRTSLAGSVGSPGSAGSPGSGGSGGSAPRPRWLALCRPPVGSTQVW